MLAHIVLPVLFGMAFVGFSLVAQNGPFTWMIAIDTGLDLAILSIGATGALLDNPKLVERFGVDSILVGLVVVAVNLLLSSVMLMFKRWSGEAPRMRNGVVCLFLGVVTLVVVGSVAAIGFRATVPPPKTSNATAIVFAGE